MVTYEVNEKKRTVVARYVGGAEEVRESLTNTLIKINELGTISFDISIYKFLADYEYRFNMIGVAKCHEDDTFDVEKGKQLALKRLNRKFAVLRKDVLRSVLVRMTHLFNHTVDKIQNKLK